MEQLDSGDAARKNLKNEVNLANQKIINLEEELYGVRNTNAELLEQFKDTEDKLEATLEELANKEKQLEEVDQLHGDIQEELENQLGIKDGTIKEL